MTALVPTLEDAIILATQAHRNAVDLDSREYILHPLRVMLSFTDREDTDARMVAVLHDIVEDTEVTVEDLLEMGYSLQVVAAIQSLSRNERETYENYIRRLSTNKLAVKVKLADLKDNLDPKRHSTSLLKSVMIQRYREALTYLQEIITDQAKAALTASGD